VRDVFEQHVAAARHSLKELAQVVGEQRRALAGGGDQPRKQAIGQQADVFGEQAEQQPDQEVGGALRVFAVLAQQLGQLGELARRGLGDLCGGLRGAEGLVIIEDIAQALEPGRREQVVERDGEDLLDGVGEVGMDDDLLDVGDDQQRRVLERLAVL
jgi:hypothetical protein